EEPDTKGLVGVDLCGREDELLGLAGADQTRQPLRAAEIGQDPVLELEETRFRAFGEDAQVACQRELEPGSEGVPAYSGDRRVRRLFEPRVGILRLHDRIDGGILVTARLAVVGLERARGFTCEHRRAPAPPAPPPPPP